MTTAIYTHSACLDHRPGPHHPESPQRLLTVLAALKAPEFDALQWHEAPLGTREQLLRVHTAAYVDEVEAIAPTSAADGLRALDGGDTVLSPGSLEAALRGVGAACAAVDQVMAGAAAEPEARADAAAGSVPVHNAFCATRPCGHHAEADRAMGFCIYNQAAIAALHARAQHGLQRVAVVDFDVHHGNGTQNSFWNDPDLFYGSSHQADFYPGTGAQHETGSAHNIVNVPLQRGCSSAAFRARFAEVLLPALRRFAPQLLIISAGFDAHGDDALGGLRLNDDDFHWVTTELMAVADACCQGRVVSVLEGGYSVDGLAGGTRAHVRALMSH